MSYIKIIKNKIYNIEALRCFAVILQHIDHLFPYSIPVIRFVHHYLGGGFGVDLFLTVSGFLVAQSLLSKIENCNNFHKKIQIIINFWVKRLWRLWPATWVCLTSVLVCVIFFNESKSFGTLSANIDASIAGFFHFANFRFYSTFLQSEYGASFVYWSLSLEEQFYFLFPIILLLLPKNKTLYFIIICIALQVFTARSQNLLLIFFRTDAIMLGVIIAYTHKNNLHIPFILKIKNQKDIYYKIFLALILILMSLFTGGELISQYKYSWLAMLSFILVFIASLNLDKFSAQLPIKKLLFRLTNILAPLLNTYSCILLNKIVNFQTKQAWTNEHKQLISLYSSSNFTCSFSSHCSYRYIENPLRIFGRKIINKNSRKEPHEYT